MTTYPPAPLTLQKIRALDYTHSQVAYVGHDGTIFHISGPFAPELGAQTGVVMQNVAHLDPPMKHLDNKGARQDGTTWYDTLYDPTEIDMVVELGGTDAASTRKVIRDWFGAWDPKKLGKLCWFSPERGEWVANVRMNKPVQDQFKQDWYQARGTTFTWSARNDNAFWQGVDSVCNYTNDSNLVGDTFQRVDSSGLEANWDQTTSGPGYIATNDNAYWATSGTTTGTAIARYIGQYGRSPVDNQFNSVTLAGNMPACTNQVQTVTISGAPTGGTFTLAYNGSAPSTAIAYNASAATVQSAIAALSTVGTGNVSVTGSAGGPYTVTFIGALAGYNASVMTAVSSLTGGTSPTVTPAITTAGVSAYVDVWDRMNTSGTAGTYGVRLRIGYGTLLLSVFNNGTQHDVWKGTFTGTGVTGDVFTLQCGVLAPQQNVLEKLFSGTNWTPGQYQIYQNGNAVIGVTATAIQDFFGSLFGFTDANNYSTTGAGYRGWGFGMSAGGTGTGQLTPPPISKWTGGCDTGFITLTNIGDQPAWPRYLCYGPGTFLIGDGPGSSNMISFGPLLEGQVALVITMPRLANVVDMTPVPSQSQATLWNSINSGVQGFLSKMINFVTNNNVPPLLQQFESLFGISPPQGPLYSLLSGRFTTPIDPMEEQTGPMVSHIPCQIQGGNSKSKIVAAITPQRRWPE